jgi:TonB-linked SusC/RagA family outer membrane protein
MTGEPLPGVSIVVRGTTRGTVSDANGKYAIEVPAADAVLLISSIGYLDEEVAVNGRSVIDIKLVESIESLEEVVVVGYGTTKRSDLTGSVGSVKGDEIGNQTVNSVAAALQSRVSGVKINTSSGAPGSNSQIFIRGFGNFQGIPPLWIIDGVQYSGDDPGSKISFKDIESIDILKDGSSSAIYGSQGAGGVIIVTTKSGKAGKMQVNFSTGHSVTTNYNLPEMLNKEQYIETRNAYFPNGVWNGVNVNNYPTTDWMDVITQNGNRQTYDFSVAGGNNKSTFYIGTNYMKEKGTLVDSNIERLGLRINSDHKLAKWATFGERIYLYRTNNEGVATSPRSIYRTSPGSSIYDENNTNPWYPGTWGYLDGASPWLGYNAYAFTKISRSKGNNEALEGSIYMALSPIKGLEWKTTGGIYANKSNGSNAQTPFYLGPQANSGTKDRATYNENWGNSYKYTFNTVLTYDLVLGNHNISPMAGFESILGSWAGINGGFNHYYNKSWPTMLDQAQQDPGKNWYRNVGSSNADMDRLYSYFGRLKYNFSNKYFLTLNIRRDASSKFGTNNRVGIFPSASVAWKINEEAFLSNSSLFSILKLRAEYGAVGNDRIPSLYYLKFYENSQNYSFENSLGSSGIQLQSKLPNNDIKWEAMITHGVALDWGILQNKLTGTFGYYSKSSNDLLYNLPIQASAGLGSNVFTNIGKVKNSGLEIDVLWKESRGDFSYSIGINGATLKNEVINLDGIDNAPIEGSAGVINEQGNQVFYKSEVGKPFASFYGYKTTGIMQPGQTAPYATGPSNTSPLPGDLLYVDVNNDGAINDKDKQYIGNPWAKFSYGINASVEWKGLDINVLFSGEAGQDVINARTPIIGTIYGDYNTTSDIYNNSLFLGNEITDRPAHLQANGTVDPNGNYRVFSDFWVEKGSFLKLRNLQFGYTLPQNLLNKYGVGKIRIYLAGQNLLTFTKYSGIDPETTAGTVNNVISGGMADNNTYFPIRTYTIGLDLSF